mgnify:CR=1 FL=1
MGNKIKVVLADDHNMYTDALTKILEAEPNILVSGITTNGEKLIELLNSETVDIVLLDLEMPIMNGEQALAIIKEKNPALKVIIMTMHYNYELMLHIINKGANGFIPKGCDLESIIKAINITYHGIDCIEFSKTLTAEIAGKSKTSVQKLFGLTSRELDILKLICKGKLNKEIANILSIVESTVEFHKKNIHVKTKLQSTAELVLFASKNELT